MIVLNNKKHAKSAKKVMKRAGKDAANAAAKEWKAQVEERA